MNEEQKLNVVERNGYKNINLKPNPAKGREGLEDGNFIIVEKTFAEGREVVLPSHKFYSCGVLYGDEEVSFPLSAKEHDAWKDLGGIGDKIKITLKKEPFINKQTGLEMIAKRLYFEKVE